MTPIVILIVCSMLGSAMLSFALMGQRPKAEAASMGRLEDAMMDQVDKAVTELRTEYAKLDAKPSLVVLKDPEGLLGKEQEAFSDALGKWLDFQGFRKRAVVTVSKDTVLASEAWPIRCSVTGGNDDVLAGRVADGWGFGWARAVVTKVRDDQKDKEREEQAERERQEAESSSEAEGSEGGWQGDGQWWGYEEEAPQDGGSAEESYEEVVQEAYVEVYDVGALSGYLPGPCAAGLQGALVSWADTVAGLRNADAGYLVASTVSGSDPCSFCVVIPSGMVDADLNWVDVTVSCSWSGGSYSFAY